MIACEPVVVPPATLERHTGYSLPTLPGWAEVQATRTYEVSNLGLGAPVCPVHRRGMDGACPAST